MLVPFLFLGGLLIVVTTPGLFALHIEDRRKAKGEMS